MRPTSDRVREAIFNSLESLDAVRDARVLDLFAGSGALGIEALSRGAVHATFVDHDRDARRAVQTNLEALGLTENADVSAADAVRLVGRGSPESTYDLVLVDPPYSFDGWSDLLDGLDAWVADGGIVVAESDRELGPCAWAELVRRKPYGGTVVTILRRTQPHLPEK